MPVRGRLLLAFGRRGLGLGLDRLPQCDPARQQDLNLQPAISPHLSLANEGGNRSKAASIDLDRFGISLHRPWLRSQLDVDVRVVAVAARLSIHHSGEA